MLPTELVTLNEQARALSAQEPERARSLAAQAAALARAQHHHAQLGQALHTMGACELELGDYRRALTSLAEAAGLLRAEPDNAAVLIRTELLLLRGHFLNGQYEQALRHGHEALGAAREAQEPALEARALNDLGLVHGQLSAFEQALEHLLSSLKIREALGEAPAASPLNNIGNIYLQQEDPDRALEYFMRALQAFRAEGSSRGEALALGNIARTHEALGQLEQARAFHLASLALARSSSDPGYLAPTLSRLGALLGKLGDVEGASACFEEAVALHERHAAPFREETLLAQAELLLGLQAYEKSLPLYRTVHEIAIAGMNRDLTMQAEHGLFRAHEGVGRWQDALTHHKRYHALGRELDRERYSNRTLALLWQHEVEQSKRERELLQSKNGELNEAYDELKSLHAKLERQAEELERLSFEDALTGLPNRRSLELHLNDEFVRVKRYGGTFSVMMADIDDFKRINDGYSHAVGDEILVGVGSLLRKYTRGMDLPSRFGGEEFVVLFPETGLADAVSAAEKVRRAIESHPWPEPNAGLRITLSVGVAEIRGHNDIRGLLAEADAQLHRAKGFGKNRVCFRVPDPPSEALAGE